MPIKDGIVATKEILKLTSHLADAPYIVALTAYQTQKFKERCLQAGMQEYLTKPINED